MINRAMSPRDARREDRRVTFERPCAEHEHDQVPHEADRYAERHEWQPDWQGV